MATNSTTSYENLGYAFDKVLFQKGKPVLDSELNLSQELIEILSQKSTAHLPSGWLSYRPYYCSKDFGNSFYTQDPTATKPEVALVNGWPIYVTNTNTPLKNVNKIQFNDDQLRSGSRVDGVFLEVWRSVISPQDNLVQTEESAKPQPVSKVSTIYGIWMYNENIGWAVGENGTILKTTDAGTNWVTVDTPVHANFKKIRFFDLDVGYAIADKGVVLKTLDGGESWFSLATPITDILNDIYIINEQNICIVGNNGTILLTIDGTSLNLVSQTAGITDDLYGVTFFDTAVGWAVGNSGTLLMTKDGGNSWQKFAVTDTSTGSAVTEKLVSVAFYNLNDGISTGENGTIFRTSDSGFTWANMSDRIWHEGAYKSIQEIFPDTTTHFNKVFIRNEFNVKFTIAVYPDSKNYFKNLTYKISPPNYPNSLVLEFTGTRDNINYIKVLDLDQYATAEALRDAINNITNPYLSEDAALPYEDRQKVRVFESTIEYESFAKPSDFRPTAGSFSVMNPASLSFSVEDRAWIAGDNGVALISSNSGSKWELLDLGIRYDLNDLYYVSDNKGWYAGSDGSVIKHDSEGAHPVSVQSTDLITRVQGRIFPEGNVLSNAEEYLKDNIIDPQVGVETTKRVQLQYRVRIAAGVDPFNHPEAGLGHEYIYSQGPNNSTGNAGNYIFENMGPENGDYGLWRSLCRNTYDGYSWAVPMFFVTRRNSSAFNIDNNINGSTYFDLSAIRPDGLSYEEIVEDDVMDIRRQVVVQSYSCLLEKNLEKLLSNNLKTNISDRTQTGLQYGTSILMADQYTGNTEITNLIQGGVSSAATIVEDQKLIDPNIQITTSELTFGPRDDGLYHNEKAYYRAIIVRDGVDTSEIVTGTFEGLGTNTVIFHIADNFSPAGGTLTGVQYRIITHYLKYNNEGLSRVPKTPVSIKYQPNPADISQVYYFNGISSRDTKKVLEYLTEEITGYPDHSVLYSAQPVLDNVQDQALYELLGNTSVIDPDAQKSLRKYRGQQFRGSLVEYHHFMKVEVSTTTIRVPKNLNGYAIYGARSVYNVNGSSYKIAVAYQEDLSLRDREIVGSSLNKDNILIYLDEAFVIPAGAVIEVILEACVTGDTVGGPVIDTGITVDNIGETQGALRTSFTANYNVASRGVGGMYVGDLYSVTLSNLTTTLTIDLSSTTVSGLIGGTILGIASCETKDSKNQLYAWYQSSALLTSPNPYFTMAPIQSVTGFGTSKIVITFDPRKTLNSGIVQIPLLVKMATLPNLDQDSATAVATVFYKSLPYQAVGNLPSELTLEIVNMSDFVFITNLGTGASEVVRGEPYEIPAEHIAVNDDTVQTDNMFSNVDDLDFNNFVVNTGFVKMPGILSQYVGEDLTLSAPNNNGDKVGRPYYKESSVNVIAQAENLTVGAPRKVFVPMIGRVRSDITAPFMRGELVLVLFSKVYKARLDNKTGYFEDDDVEYSPGYLEYANTAVSVCRLTNKPLVRK